MGMQTKVFKVKALVAQDIVNGVGQVLHIKKGDIGTFQVITNLGGGGEPMILLINVEFNGNGIHIRSKGYIAPNADPDAALQQIILKHDNGQQPLFQILNPSPMTNTMTSRADGTTDATTAKTQKIENIVSVASGLGLVAGIAYSFKNNKGVGAYLGYSIAGILVFGTLASIGGNLLIKE